MVQNMNEQTVNGKNPHPCSTIEHPDLKEVSWKSYGYGRIILHLPMVATHDRNNNMIFLSGVRKLDRYPT